MKVLVTGAGGFIGREIVSLLEARKFYVKKIVSRRSSIGDSSDEDYFAADIADRQDVFRLSGIGGVEAVIHAAGLAHQFGDATRADFFAANALGTENICLLAARLKAVRFILISSVSVYGGAEKGNRAIDENFSCKPEGFYAESKLASEKRAREICEAENISLTILRPATVIGEGDAGNFARLIEAIDKRKFFWLGKGANSKSLIYKRDVARACLRVLESSAEKCEIFNLSAEALKMSEIVACVSENLGKKVPGIHFPLNPAQKFLRALLKIYKNRRAENLLNTLDKWAAEDSYSAAKIKRILAFSPEVSAREAIEREVEWYKNK